MKSFFEWIRDMPFEVRKGEKGYLADITYILRERRGSCSPKHYLLGRIYEKMGLDVVYMIHPFLWQDQNIDFPNSLKKLSKRMPMCFHLNISANNLLFDATWDPPLARAGFIVNEILSMKNGVLSCGESTIQLNKQKQASAQERNQAEDDVRWEFYSQLNKWLNSLRE